MCIYEFMMEQQARKGWVGGGGGGGDAVEDASRSYNKKEEGRYINFNRGIEEGSRVYEIYYTWGWEPEGLFTLTAISGSNFPLKLQSYIGC